MSSREVAAKKRKGEISNVKRRIHCALIGNL